MDGKNAQGLISVSFGKTNLLVTASLVKGELQFLCSSLYVPNLNAK
jgi:hypothetical protein